LQTQRDHHPTVEEWTDRSVELHPRRHFPRYRFLHAHSHSLSPSRRHHSLLLSLLQCRQSPFEHQPLAVESLHSVQHHQLRQLQLITELLSLLSDAWALHCLPHYHRYCSLLLVRSRFHHCHHPPLRCLRSTLKARHKNVRPTRGRSRRATTCRLLLASNYIREEDLSPHRKP